MKIDVNRIPSEGLRLFEELRPQELELETDSATFHQPIKITAAVFRVYNVVSVDMVIEACLYASCCRCLEEFQIDFRKQVDLNYPVDKRELLIDLNPEIREEIILNYPLKPLCKADCQGLCPRCGRNLNEGGCSCGPT